MENPHPMLGKMIENKIERVRSTTKPQVVILSGRLVLRELRKASKDCIILPDDYSILTKLYQLLRYCHTGVGIKGMTVLDYVTMDIIMLQYWLLLLVLTYVEGIKIEKEVGFAELRESHGWYLLGGVSLSEGKVIISSKIELISTLREDKKYNMEIVLMNE